MAICETCHQEMLLSVGCTLKRFDDMNGGPYLRIPYEGEHGPCRDCLVLSGQLHHPGCSQERCPKCNGQAISCDCTDCLN